MGAIIDNGISLIISKANLFDLFSGMADIAISTSELSTFLIA